MGVGWGSISIRGGGVHKNLRSLFGYPYICVDCYEYVSSSFGNMFTIYFRACLLCAGLMLCVIEKILDPHLHIKIYHIVQ